MKNQETVQHTNRRAVLKLTGLGVLGGLIANIFSPRTAHASPALAYSSWIHGHSMHIEYPDRISSVKRTGFSIQIDNATRSGSNWFHFAVPTPVIVNTKRLKVGSVMLRFNTGSGALVNHVHVYDGEKRIARHENVNLSGKNMLKRFDVPGHPSVNWGLGISIHVSFTLDSPSNKMEFFSVGCDFIA